MSWATVIVASPTLTCKRALTRSRGFPVIAGSPPAPARSASSLKAIKCALGRGSSGPDAAAMPRDRGRSGEVMVLAGVDDAASRQRGHASQLHGALAMPCAEVGGAERDAGRSGDATGRNGSDQQRLVECVLENEHIAIAERSKGSKVDLQVGQLDRYLYPLDRRSAAVPVAAGHRRWPMNGATWRAAALHRPDEESQRLSRRQVCRT